MGGPHIRLPTVQPPEQRSTARPLHAQRAANIIVSMGLGCAFVSYGVAEMVTNAGDA